MSPGGMFSPEQPPSQNVVLSLHIHQKPDTAIPTAAPNTAAIISRTGSATSRG